MAFVLVVCVGGMHFFPAHASILRKINDLSKLTVTQMRRHYQSALNDEIVNATSVSCLFVIGHIRLILILMRLTCSSAAFLVSR